MVDHKKQWFFLIFVALWLTAAMFLPIIAFCLTGNVIALSFFTTLAPPILILHRVAKSLFPLGENDTKVALEKHKRGRTSHQELDP